MKRNLFVVFVLVAISIPFTACSWFKSPTGPSDLLPDPNRYETLPAKHYLLDPSGNQTEMWAKLNWVNPERGSTVILGPSACPNCTFFRFSMEGGLDMIDGETNVNVGAYFETWFSLDGKEPLSGDPSVYRLNGGGVFMGQSMEIGSGSSFKPIHQPVPKFVLVNGSYRRSWTCPCPPGGRPDPVRGSTAFELDYR